MQEKEDLDIIKFKLQVIDNLYKMRLFDRALENLKEINLDDHHPFAARRHYCRGRCYVSTKKWKQGEKALFTGLRIANQNPRQDNMESAIYMILSLSSYYQNNLEQALTYANNGIHALSSREENKHIKFDLYCNKGPYLQRINRITKAMRLIQDIWEELPHVEDINTLLVFYWLRAELCRVSGLFEEAMDYAFKGLDIASRNQQFHSMCDLWTVLGSIYTTTKKWDLAETAFSMALQLEKHFERDERLVTVYTRLGVLHMKQNKNESAYPFLLTAIQYAEEYNDIPRLSTSLVIMGNLCHSINNKQEAIHFYNKALQLSAKHGYINEELKIWLGLARCYDGTNNKEFNRCVQKIYHVQKQIDYLEVKYIEHQI